MKYILLCALWVLWCFLHSFFTSTKTTAWFKNFMGDKFAFYRIFYNVFSLITVLLLFYWQMKISGPVVIKLSPVLLIVKYTALILSAILVAGSFLSFNVKKFSGIGQIASRHQKTVKPVISKHGFYGVVRHPMYLGGVIFFTALMTGAPLARFLGYLILGVYMIIGTIREDRRLANELGEGYRNYQKEVPMFLPKILPVTRRED
ncbi:MAG: isoprenylcysteine carboxylmethyltransferase family protein [Nitrospirota bacterium]